MTAFSSWRGLTEMQRFVALVRFHQKVRERISSSYGVVPLQIDRSKPRICIRSPSFSRVVR